MSEFSKKETETEEVIEKPVDIELSPETVEEIENLKLVIPEDKMFLLLVASGVKSASFFALAPESKLDSPQTKEYIDIIKKCNLQFEARGATTGNKKRQQKFIEILVAGNSENLKLLHNAVNSQDDELIGAVCGIPKTAIEAYIGKRKALNRDELPDQIKKSDAVHFSIFQLSADNWQEEIRLGQKYADFVKKISPKTYKEIMEGEKT